MKKDKDLLIYIVDDDFFYSTFLWNYFNSRGYKNIITFQNPKKCIDQLFKIPDLIILDYYMLPMNGLKALSRIKTFDPNIPVVLLSGKASIKVAVDSLKYGSLDFIEKNDKTLENLGTLMDQVELIKAIGLFQNN